MDKNKKPHRLYLWWVRHKLTSFYYTTLFFCVIIYLIADHYDITWLCTIALCTVFTFAVIFIIHDNQQSLHRFLYNNKDVSHLPESQIRHLNKFFLSVFMLITAAIMFFTSRLPYQKILSVLWSWIKSGLRFLFSLLASDSDEVIEETVEEIPQQEPFVLDELMKMTEEEEHNPFWDHLVRILAVLILIACFFYLVRSILYKIRTREKKEAFEEREFISPFAKKEKQNKSAVYKERSLTADLSFNGRIRKLYRKTVNNSLPLKHIPLKSLTPMEIEKQAGLGKYESEQQLHEIYEKARYSESGCTKQDYEVLRKQKK